MQYHNTDLEEGKRNPRVQLQGYRSFVLTSQAAEVPKMAAFCPHSHWHSSYTHQAPPHYLDSKVVALICFLPFEGLSQSFVASCTFMKRKQREIKGSTMEWRTTRMVCLRASEVFPFSHFFAQYQQQSSHLVTVTSCGQPML